MRHGGDLGEARRLHGAEHAWLDLSTGINPHPWPIPPDAIAASDWTRLPSGDDLAALLAAARQAYGVPPDLALVAAPGTQAIIQWLPHVAPPGAVTIVGPTYSEHEASWRHAGREVFIVPTLAQAPERAAHVVLVNPNNPDGRIVPQSDLAAAASVLARRGGWLVIDESFADTAPEASAIGRVGEGPVVVLRSFGKFFGLAGLRLGFAVAPPGLAGSIARAFGPWAVAGPALAIGRLALADPTWADAMRERLRNEAAALDAVLGEGGGAVVGGTSLFRLLKHPRALALHAHLARRGIWVRRFDWAPDRLRIGLPVDAAGLDRLGDALRDFARGHRQADESR